MIISVVLLMVATTYHCSAQPSIRFRQIAARIFWAQEPDVDAEKNRAMMVKTISRLVWTSAQGWMSLKSLVDEYSLRRMIYF